MIREFALEPEVLSSWQAFRYFTEKFSVPQGRLISEFPRSWRRLVYEAAAHCQDVEKKRIEEGLSRIKHRLMRRGRDYSPALSWLANAVISHEHHRFRAIIAREAHPTCLAVIPGDGADDQQPALKEKRSAIIRRRASDMTIAIGPLLDISDELILVDPHFNPRSRNYRIPLERFLERFVRGDRKPKRLEFHLGDGNTGRSPGTPYSAFVSDCQSTLPRCVPRETTLLLVRWVQTGMHNRYVLTERGAIEFGTGLDEATSTSAQTDTVKLLDEGTRMRIWNQYCGCRGELALANDPGPIEIRGMRSL